VAVATLASSGCDHELGVLVASARASGVDHIVADVLGEDSFVLSALRRVGPLAVTLEWGVSTARVALGSVSGESDVP